MVSLWNIARKWYSELDVIYQDECVIKALKGTVPQSICTRLWKTLLDLKPPLDFDTDRSEEAFYDI